MTVGPLLSMISSSEWIPTNKDWPSRRACSIAPACPEENVQFRRMRELSRYLGMAVLERTMVAKIEASINPYPIL